MRSQTRLSISIRSSSTFSISSLISNLTTRFCKIFYSNYSIVIQKCVKLLQTSVNDVDMFSSRLSNLYCCFYPSIFYNSSLTLLSSIDIFIFLSQFKPIIFLIYSLYFPLICFSLFIQYQTHIHINYTLISIVFSKNSSNYLLQNFSQNKPYKFVILSILEHASIQQLQQNQIKLIRQFINPQFNSRVNRYLLNNHYQHKLFLRPSLLEEQSLDLDVNSNTGRATQFSSTWERQREKFQHYSRVTSLSDSWHCQLEDQSLFILKIMEEAYDTSILFIFFSFEIQCSLSFKSYESQMTSSFNFEFSMIASVSLDCLRLISHQRSFILFYLCLSHFIQDKINFFASIRFFYIVEEVLDNHLLFRFLKEDNCQKII